MHLQVKRFDVSFLRGASTFYVLGFHDLSNGTNVASRLVESFSIVASIFYGEFGEPEIVNRRPRRSLEQGTKFSTNRTRRRSTKAVPNGHVNLIELTLSEISPTASVLSSDFFAG